MAQLAGFQSYGHRALRGTMGATPERVMDFLQLLAEKVDHQKCLLIISLSFHCPIGNSKQLIFNGCLFFIINF